ncbi:DUF4259 domain-containing protein [Streptomyces sp. SP18BB07]|nr:DUF4259 domain-containing protein [Streptomyces sp. SP18BB07]
MGTWNTGPFDNDTAADFAGDLDDAKSEEREALIRGVLTRPVDVTGWLTEGEEAVAAAALIAVRCPGGAPIDTPFGPEEPMPPSLTISGHSRTRPSLVSSATRPVQPRTGSTRKTGSNGEPTSTAFLQSLLRHHRPSRCSMSSSDVASPITRPEGRASSRMSFRRKFGSHSRGCRVINVDVARKGEAGSVSVHASWSTTSRPLPTRCSWAPARCGARIPHRCA